jgi:bacteriocin-type transport-associated protein
MRKVLYILGHLSDEDIEWLARTGIRRKVHKGEVLIYQGKPVDALFVVLDGHLTVSVKDIGEVAKLKVGEIVGEMSFVDSRPPSATVAADEEATVLVVKKELLQDKLDHDIAFSARFHKALSIFLAERLRGTVQHLGYGQDTGLDGEDDLEDELDLNALDNLSLAGTRFDWMIKKLMAV